MKDLCLIFDEVLQIRQPSLVYSIYLKEQFLKWQVNRIKMGIPYALEIGAQFLQAYFECTEQEKYLICEFYVHDFLFSGNIRFFPGAYIGYVQIQAFVSVLHNHIQWVRDVEQFQQRSMSDNFWIKQQPIYNIETHVAFKATTTHKWQ